MGAPSGQKAHLTRSGQGPSGSRFLLLSHGEVGYADFLNCSNRSASRSRSGRSSPRLGISNRSREYKEAPVGGNAGVSEADDPAVGGWDRPREIEQRRGSASGSAARLR